MPDIEGDGGTTTESYGESTDTGGGVLDRVLTDGVRGNLSFVGGIVLGGLAYVLAFASISGLFLATEEQQNVAVNEAVAVDMLADESKREVLLAFLTIVRDANPEGGSGALRLLGWIFYNAHGVKLSVGTEGGLSLLVLFADSTLVYALIPAALLFCLGGLVALFKRADGFLGGFFSGSSVVMGYLPLVVVGALFATVSGAGSTVSVQLLPAILLAGILYPLVCGGAAGLLKVLVINVFFGGIRSRL
ncbi:hypothetical protein [Haloarcula onubensis]|uniref:DUF7978 domain-containing protein n=1 Tax=Haloarcula onubensis TaxID=2950539 RepID=A0ABU2FME7_9EURY|nr:hypothetical protein [Halomicroarcula sp. S3CR25-11]MDS0281934.1 hypothetical protein [Halomicroarcula sp. S3CR25-11]